MSWALLFSQVINCAADQCLVHFSRTENISVHKAWQIVLRLKGIILTLGIGAAIFLELYSYASIPVLTILCIVPAFYLPSVFEASGLNMEYAGIGFCEKIFFFLLLLPAFFLGSIKLVVGAYFIVSIISLYAQLHLTKIFSYAVGKIDWRLIKKYIHSYHRVKPYMRPI